MRKVNKVLQNQADLIKRMVAIEEGSVRTEPRTLRQDQIETANVGEAFMEKMPVLSNKDEFDAFEKKLSDRRAFEVVVSLFENFLIITES